MNAIAPLPRPANEPVLGYAPGTGERQRLKQRLDEMLREEIEIPAVIGGREVRTGNLGQVVCPHQHDHVLASVHRCGADEVEAAVEAAGQAWSDWAHRPWEERAAVFLRAAELLAGPRRATIAAATMLGQSKTVHQAEIDGVCELIDFWRFNPHYMSRIYAEQPGSPVGAWNRADYRPLEGFVLAITPFNFASIGGNLPTAPAMMGNTVLWKPSSTSLLANYYTMRVLEEAGLPPGVINFLPGRGPDIGTPALTSPELAGVHFTGSAPTFHHIWRLVGESVHLYRTFPRVVGETGGKDFVFVHPSAELDALATALVRGAFEYQGQKCSAASRAYVPRSLWPELRQALEETVSELGMGSPLDFRNFLCALIDERAFRKVERYLEEARGQAGYEIVCGGESDGSEGWFVEPTVVLSEDPRSRLMTEEIFGPVLTVFVYEDSKLDEALELCDTTSPYGLTGAIFANDRAAITEMSRRLRFAAGNFYVNDKPTGAVVGQQPFGGARGSGTNDKAGSILNLLRWTSQRIIKETFVPPTDHGYPHMEDS